MHDECNVRKRAKIKNRYNQAPHLTQDTNGKVTSSQLDITNESKEVSLFPAGDYKASINITKHNKNQGRNNISDPQKKHRLRTVSKILEGLNLETLELISKCTSFHLHLNMTQSDKMTRICRKDEGEQILENFDHNLVRR